MTISVVLLDADGVIQLASPGWRSAWEELIGNAENTDQFLSDIFAMEFPFLCGGQGFENELQKVLDQWGCPEAVDRALQIWTMIDPCEDILDMVRPIRNSGLSVGLATNQQEHRFRYMINELGYGEIFDYCFVSCEMGVSKPSKQYFLDVVAGIGCAAEEILFIDDHQPNVSAARDIGLEAEVFDLRDGTHNMKRLLEDHGISVT